MRYLIFVVRPELYLCKSDEANSRFTPGEVRATYFQEQAATKETRIVQARDIPVFASALPFPSDFPINLWVRTPYEIDEEIRDSISIMAKNGQHVVGEIGEPATVQRPAFYRDWLGRLGPYLANGYGLQSQELRRAVDTLHPDLRPALEYLSETFVCLCGGVVVGDLWVNSRTSLGGLVGDTT